MIGKDREVTSVTFMKISRRAISLAGRCPSRQPFESDDDMISFYFRSISHIETDVSKNRSELSLLIATGDFVMTLSGTMYTGIVYLDGKETLKKNSSGEVISVSLNAKIAGGDDLAFTFSGSIKPNLTK